MKQIAWVVLGWSALLATAQAASFDCEKAGNHVEELICTNDELSKLDERMAGLYETALLDEKLAGKVKQTQRQWLKERNSCSDAACVKSAYETRMRGIFPDNKARAVLPGRKFQASLDSKNWVVVFMNSKIDEERAIALRNINNQERPDRQKYNEIGLLDSSSKVRSFAASFYNTELNKLTPILLKIIASDPDQQVRFSATMNLTCQFTCNGTEYTDEDIRALEENLPLVESGIRTTENEEMGRMLLEMLDFVWCDLTTDSQKKLTSLLSSDLPITQKTGSQISINHDLNLSAKRILNGNLENSCGLLK